jgi:hypothetical protein
MRLRTAAEFSRFFGGLELVTPGVVPINHWQPGLPPDSEQGEALPAYAAPRVFKSRRLSDLSERILSLRRSPDNVRQKRVKVMPSAASRSRGLLGVLGNAVVPGGTP